MAAGWDETCALSLPHLHPRSPLAPSHTHKHGAAAAARAPPSRPPTSRTEPAELETRSPPPLRALRERSAHSLRAPLAHRSRLPVVLTRALRAGPETGILAPRPSLTPSALLPWFAEGRTPGMGTPSAPLSVLRALLLLGCTWLETGSRAESARPGLGLRGLSTSPGPRSPAASCRLPGRAGCLPAPLLASLPA